MPIGPENPDGYTKRVQSKGIIVLWYVAEVLRFALLLAELLISVAFHVPAVSRTSELSDGRH
jgi:hypothetical protein